MMESYLHLQRRGRRIPGLTDASRIGNHLGRLYSQEGPSVVPVDFVGNPQVRTMPAVISGNATYVLQLGVK